MKGSLTIEAAYIYPFCFLIIGIVCALGIYQYNRAVLEMTGYECILQTMEERELEEEIFKENLLRRVKQESADRTFGIKDLQVSLKMTPSKISINYEGIQAILDVPMEVTVVYERTYPELTLKLTRGISGE